MKKETRKRTLARALVCGFILAAAASFLPFAAASEQLPQHVLRLHVVANSNSEADQAVKLQVRDAVLREAARWYGDAENLEQANFAVCTHLQSLTKAANEALRENGFPMNAKAQVTDMYFPTRWYDGIALPAGTYRTLRVTIGEGKGKNWWCVLYPPLCLPACGGQALSEVLTESQIEILESAEEYEFRFAALELYQALKERLENAAEE